ncbi:MAG: phosphoribosyltransferase-like protein [Terriglobia bacterium]
MNGKPKKGNSARRYLYDIVMGWEAEARLDPSDSFPYLATLDEILFHAELRFYDYKQYQDEGSFSQRLLAWLENVTDDRQRKALFQVLPWILFVDALQMESLYRDGYRRVVVPWLCEGRLSGNEVLAEDLNAKLLSVMRRFCIMSITQSFSNPEFLHVNNLSSLPTPVILGDDPQKVAAALLPLRSAKVDGLIVLEDFVGTGDQARRVLLEIMRSGSSHWRILFVPLLILEKGLKALTEESKLKGISIRPVLVLPDARCLREEPGGKDHPDFKRIRALVQATSMKVLRPLRKELDDPPENAFGYKGSGAMVVTCHNTPNNTLPLIHHRAPEWAPLFRRIHHSKDGL